MFFYIQKKILTNMAWLSLNTPNYESLIVVYLASNHGHHFTTNKNEVLLGSLASKDKDCRVINGMRDPMSKQPPIATYPSPSKFLPKDIGAFVPPSKRLRKEKEYMPTLE